MASIGNFVEISSRDIICDPDKYEAGSGGSCDVVIGFHKTSKEFVAVKVTNVTGGLQDKTLIKRILEEEMGYLQKMNHPNIVRVIGWVEWDFAFGIVMEFCQGGNLKQLILDYSIPLGVPLRLWLLTMTSRALAECHTLHGGKRLAHNDIKLENVLLDINFICKLCDFGASELATLTGSTTVDSSAKTKKERPQYTPKYTAPEKLQRLDMKSNQKLDVYAFGIMTYAVIFRKLPFPLNTSPDAIIGGLRPDCSTLDELKQTPSDNDKVIVEELESIMKQCWDEDPSARPTMSEVYTRLKNLLHQQNSEEITHQLEEAKRVKQINNPPLDNFNPRVPLHQFSTRDRKFKESESEQDVTRVQSSSGADAESEMQMELSISQADTTAAKHELISKYFRFMEIGNYEAADHVKMEYMVSLQSPKEDVLRSKADEYFKAQKYWEAMMFYEMAFEQFARGYVWDKAALGITGCVEELKNVAEKLINGTQLDSLTQQRRKRVVQGHVIPFMQKMKNKIRNLDNVDEQEACIREVHCLESIKECQGLISDIRGKIETLNQILAIVGDNDYFEEELIDLKEQCQNV